MSEAGFRSITVSLLGLLGQLAGDARRLPCDVDANVELRLI